MARFKEYIDINPLRTLGAILALGQAVILLAQTLWWSLEEAGLLAVESVWVAFIAVIATIFKPNATASVTLETES